MTQPSLENPDLDVWFLHNFTKRLLTEKDSELQTSSARVQRKHQIRSRLQDRTLQRRELEQYCKTPYSTSRIQPLETSTKHIDSPNLTATHPSPCSHTSPCSSASWSRHSHCRYPSEVAHLFTPVPDISRLPISSPLLTIRKSPKKLDDNILSICSARLDSLSSPIVSKHALDTTRSSLSTDEVTSPSYLPKTSRYRKKMDSLAKENQRKKRGSDIFEEGKRKNGLPK
ncbi:hypothetical protein GEMRC1_004372 [Eukaryota sp. GEM-RC1]